jgi:hypothetical protein
VPDLSKFLLILSRAPVLIGSLEIKLALEPASSSHYAYVGQQPLTKGTTMATLGERVKQVAEGLIVAAAFGQAVAAADIKSQAQQLQSNYADYSQHQISEKIAAEIKKSYNPGISGSL